MTKNVLHVCIAARTGSVQASTVLKIQEAGYYMGKDSVAWHIWSGSWLIYARKTAIEEAYTYEENLKQAPFKAIRGLLMDDDVILLDDSQSIAKTLINADKQGFNITASYPAANGTQIISKRSNYMERYTDEELRHLYNTTEFEPITGDIGTTGFYYGELPKGYDWHMSSQWDEATLFFRDNAYLNVKLATRIRLAHRANWIRSIWQDFDETTP
jgi:hypothetical protein